MKCLTRFSNQQAHWGSANKMQIQDGTEVMNKPSKSFILRRDGLTLSWSAVADHLVSRVNVEGIGSYVQVPVEVGCDVWRRISDGELGLSSSVGLQSSHVSLEIVVLTKVTTQLGGVSWENLFYSRVWITHDWARGVWGWSIESWRVQHHLQMCWL